ncbi:hypothetical protein [Aureibacter tunicatorum]|uniref:Uncharacterized protein n=1 Tax=Aureibacter tunicatorum TaxID=866807 RepID=A0AAE3XRX4_9BACT|nr:hypothetical protein [Aureibacter tunicatorum]MDR6241507.1 hypothetical protein [Aureibacter tunicatorum]BDD07035.1 hypothetical protein AUTU_45180 [Aureibacter tunicatorum]
MLGEYKRVSKPVKRIQKSRGISIMPPCQMMLPGADSASFADTASSISSPEYLSTDEEADAPWSNIDDIVVESYDSEERGAEIPEDEEEVWTSIDDITLEEQVDFFLQHPDFGQWQPAPEVKEVLLAKVGRKVGLDSSTHELPTLSKASRNVLTNFLHVKGETGVDYLAVIDRFERGINAVSGINGKIGQITGYIGQLAKGKVSEDSAIVAEFSSGIGCVLGMVIPILKVFKQGVKLAKCIEEYEITPRGEILRESLQLASDFAAASQQILSATASVMQLATKIPSPIAQAIPGFNIVISLISLAQKGISLQRNVRNFYAMTKEKRRYVDELAGNIDFAGLLDLDESTDEDALDSFKDFSTQIEYVADKSRKFELVRHLKKINRKRIIRDSMHVTTTGLNILSTILNMTGVSSQAGMAIGISSTVISTGSTVFRSVKQKWHDKGYGDQRKTTDAKNALAMNMVREIFRQMMSLKHGDAEEAERLAMLIRASGLPVKKFIHAKSTQKRVGLLYAAMKSREN